MLCVHILLFPQPDAMLAGNGPAHR
jgi:hypothetical protein